MTKVAQSCSKWPEMAKIAQNSQYGQNTMWAKANMGKSQYGKKPIWAKANLIVTIAQ
jgi:hypothetical protein